MPQLSRGLLLFRLQRTIARHPLQFEDSRSRFLGWLLACPECRFRPCRQNRFRWRRRLQGFRSLLPHSLRQTGRHRYWHRLKVPVTGDPRVQLTRLMMRLYRRHWILMRQRLWRWRWIRPYQPALTFYRLHRPDLVLGHRHHLECPWDSIRCPAVKRSCRWQTTRSACSVGR